MNIVMAINVFTKWPEAAALTQLGSQQITHWFYTEVVCKYGVPQVVRVDCGMEFQGEFNKYCRGFGIHVRRINTAWPRAQG